MKQSTLELLSPAGSWEALEAAVRSGADAVYLGGSLFSARANAQNFDHDTLKQAVAYCHARGVKVHLAVNTILLDHEIKTALDFVSLCLLSPVDAVIVQDTGLLHLYGTLHQHCKFMLPHKCPYILRKVQSYWQNKVFHGLY